MEIDLKAAGFVEDRRVMHTLRLTALFKRGRDPFSLRKTRMRAIPCKEC
jgi:hypothetical protein